MCLCLKSPILEINRHTTWSSVNSQQSFWSCWTSFIDKLYPKDVAEDEPLCESNVKKWENCLYSLRSINHFIVPRMIVHIFIPFARDVDIHEFIDANAPVAYLRTMSWESQSVLLLKTHCTKTSAMRAVHANEAGESTSNHLIIPPDRFHYYTDRRIVLGYISNTSWRFFMYVTNREEKIH